MPHFVSVWLVVVDLAKEERNQSAYSVLTSSSMDYLLVSKMLEYELVTLVSFVITHHKRLVEIVH